MRVYDLHFTCPDLTSQEDVDMLVTTLSSSPGVGMVEADWRTKKVRVETANQDGGEDVIERMIDAGFRPEETLEAT
jgi:hypothetical protein